MDEFLQSFILILIPAVVTTWLQPNEMFITTQRNVKDILRSNIVGGEL